MFKELNKSLSKKKISRKDFVKMSAIGLISIAGTSFFSNLKLEPISFRPKEKKGSYGNGAYGGR